MGHPHLEIPSLEFGQPTVHRPEGGGAARHFSVMRCYWEFHSLRSFFIGCAANSILTDVLKGKVSMEGSVYCQMFAAEHFCWHRCAVISLIHGAMQSRAAVERHHISIQDGKSRIWGWWPGGGGECYGNKLQLPKCSSALLGNRIIEFLQSLCVI